MRKNEMAYIFAVTTMVLVISALSLHRFSELERSWQDAAPAKSIGRPRTINSQQIRFLMNQGKLSDKDAKFYTTSPEIERPQPALQHNKTP
ncbi:MAG: hypothetical protein V2B20_04570 [Pseudomonadota bacterium]